MSEMKTLRELCERTGASRRAIQGYEKAGLVKAVGRNKYGYLLYGDEEEKRVKKIRFLQRMGFTLKEIEKLSHDAEDEVKRKLQERICSMKEEICEKKELISKAEEILKRMEREG